MYWVIDPKAWTLTRDVINTTCVCPYTGPRQEKRAMTVRMSRETLSDIDQAAVANDRSRDWVVMKVLLMARECLFKSSKSNVT